MQALHNTYKFDWALVTKPMSTYTLWAGGLQPRVVCLVLNSTNIMLNVEFWEQDDIGQGAKKLTWTLSLTYQGLFLVIGPHMWFSWEIIASGDAVKVKQMSTKLIR